MTWRSPLQTGRKWEASQCGFPILGRTSTVCTPDATSSTRRSWPPKTCTAGFLQNPAGFYKHTYNQVCHYSLGPPSSTCCDASSFLEYCWGPYLELYAKSSDLWYFVLSYFICNKEAQQRKDAGVDLFWTPNGVLRDSAYLVPRENKSSTSRVLGDPGVSQ